MSWQRIGRILALASAAGVIGLAMAAMGMVPGVRLAAASQSAVPCAELPGRAVPSLGIRHLAYLGEPHRPYNSTPPTSGPHLPWIIGAGVYRSPIADEYQVHLLEHGKVLLQYPPDTPAEERRRLERFGRQDPDKVVVAPNPDVRSGLALTAWQRIDLPPEYDEQRIRGFVTALAGRYNHRWSPGADDCVPG